MLISNEQKTLTLTEQTPSSDLLSDRLFPVLYAVIVHGCLLLGFFWIGNGQGDGLEVIEKPQEVALFVEIVEGQAPPFSEQTAERSELEIIPEPEQIEAKVEEKIEIPKPRLKVLKLVQKKPVVQPVHDLKVQNQTQSKPHIPLESQQGLKQISFIEPVYPAYLQNPPPLYPRSARRKREEGVVLLRVLVDETGRPLNIKLKKTSGFAALDQSAVQTVKQWRFVPARKAGITVSAEVVVPIRFSLMVE
jgi:periplasmic protein TonB